MLVDHNVAWNKQYIICNTKFHFKWEFSQIFLIEISIQVQILKNYQFYLLIFIAHRLRNKSVHTLWHYVINEKWLYIL